MSKKRDTSCLEAKDDLSGLKTDVTKSHIQYYLSESCYTVTFTDLMTKMGLSHLGTKACRGI